MTSANVPARSLLIIDDEPAATQTLCDLFVDDGFEVCACSTFEEALARCQDQQFAVAILDLRLHGRSGIELLKRIREIQPALRVIIHTAYGSFDSAKDAVNLGAFAYVEKSGSPAELISQVHRAVQDSFSEMVRTSEQRYRSLTEAAPVCIHEIDLQAKMSSINSYGLRMLGMETEDEVIGRDYLSYVSQGDRPRIETLLKAAFEGEASSFDATFDVKDEPRVFASNFIPILNELGEVARLMGTTVDITDEKSAQLALRQSERSLAQAQRIAQIGNWHYDLLSGQLSGSAEMLRIVGLGENQPQLSFESFLRDFVHPDDIDSIVRSQQQALGRGQPEPLEFRLSRQSDQVVCYVRAEAEIIFNEDGFPLRIIGTLQDITEQKKAELTLRESEEKFRVLTEKSPTIVMIARSRRLVYCNPMLSQMLGYSNEELLSMNFVDFIHPDDRELVANRHRRRLSGELVLDRYEIRARTKDGQDRWLDLSAQRIEFEGLPAVLVNLVNVTERKLAEKQLHEMESQLAHVSRLSTMGEMVAGIAHEINQPLAAISNFAEGCSNALKSIDYDSDLPIESWLQQISQQSVRCGEIIRRLRSFVNKGDQDWEWVDLNTVIRESVALIGGDTRHRSVVIECRLPNPGPLVYGSKVQLQQVLVNLLCNACDATKEKADPEICIQLEVAEGGTRLTVEDNGEGIASEQRGQLFDAFFTTKRDGLGIGLAISKSIIEKHRGILRLDPAKTSGARFHIHLPVNERDRVDP